MGVNLNGILDDVFSGGVTTKDQSLDFVNEETPEQEEQPKDPELDYPKPEDIKPDVADAHVDYLIKTVFARHRSLNDEQRKGLEHKIKNMTPSDIQKFVAHAQTKINDKEDIDIETEPELPRFATVIDTADPDKQEEMAKNFNERVFQR